MSLIQIQEPEEILQDATPQEITIGIDLGTTNSLVGIVENNKVKIFTDETGKDIIPSVIYYDNIKRCLTPFADEGFKIEGRAKKVSDTFFEISSAKRLMGKNEYILVGDKKISPEEVSAEILKYLKDIAEKNIRQTRGDDSLRVGKAVITVPAYFDEAAKNATKLAAKLAGLEVLRLVNEPTAAALAYGLENSSEGIYCVYDLGGGTFDVSILKMQKGVFKVLGVSGDNHLGGDDFDEMLAKKLKIDKKEARKIKEELSFQKRCLTPFAVEGNKIEDRAKKVSDTFFDVSLEEFEELISGKIARTIDLTTNLLDDLDLTSDEIKGVILVGGSTRIPLIGKKLSEVFGAEKILTNLDPDRVVAIGAAWQAYNLSGNSQNLLLDVAPLSLGIEMMGGIVDKVILRNSTIPTAVTKEFTTYADNQNGIKLHITQGEREFAKDCRSLAHFEIKNIPAMKAGLARVAVTFKIDADGLLTVTAEEKITKTKQEIEVKPTYGLDQNSIKKMLLESLENSKADMENRLLAKTKVDAQKDIMILKNDLKNHPELISKNEQKNIEEKILELENLCQNSSDRSAINAALSTLEKSAENLVLAKVNAAIKEKIAGKNIDEV